MKSIFFTDNKVDFEVFKDLNEATIGKIMVHYPVGIVRKFTLRYLAWKAAKPVLEPSHTISSGIIEKIIRSNVENLRFYESIDKSRPLSDAHRKELKTLVLGHFFAKKERLTTNDIHNLSKDIVELFPLENITSYYNPITKAGPLYHEYHNKAKPLRKSNLFPTFKKSTKKNVDRTEEGDVVESVEPVVIGNDIVAHEENHDEAISDDLVKVVTSSMDLQDLKQHWRNSSKLRTIKIKNIPETAKITTILKEYPVYKRADGYAFVSALLLCS